MPSHIRFTQNFLHSKPLVAKLVAKANLAQGSTVLEIGPGKGIISAELARTVGPTGRVVAVELDPQLAHKLTPLTTNNPQVELIVGDILQFDLARLGDAYSIFSNVPFNITSALIGKLFVPHGGPQQAHLILQTDALIGTNKGGYQTETLKSLLVKPLYDITVAHRFSPSDFTPRPSVATALFAFKKRSAALISPTDYATYQDFVAFVAKDRVGEGVWLRLFSKKQCVALTQRSALVLSRGLKSQPLSAILAAFAMFQQQPSRKQNAVSGAMATLRAEQAKRELVNRSGGHHRSKASTKRRR